MDDSTCFVQDIDQFVKVHAPDMDCQVVWLPTSIVDYCSKVTISMGGRYCRDVRIKYHGTGKHRDSLHSSIALHMYLRFQIYKIVAR